MGLDSKCSFLEGGGEMGERMRNFDWSASRIGPPELWPESLKTSVRIMLTSQQPFWIGWGDELIVMYNDPYSTILGAKHPSALGMPVAKLWSEILADIGPMLAQVMQENVGIFVESQLLIMERHGYKEETHFTFSFSPIPKDHVRGDRAGGVFCALVEESARVFSERQMELLREVASLAASARSESEVCRLALEGLGGRGWDVVFAAIHIADGEGNEMTLVGSCGLSPEQSSALSERRSCMQTAISEALQSRTTTIFQDLDTIWGSDLPLGAWDHPCRQAAVVPLEIPSGAGAAGALVVGLNPFRRLDESYAGFLDLLGQQLAGSIANAGARDFERKRAQELAELNRAKTVFFSNASHEFRTPLALMMGPLEELRSKVDLYSNPEYDELLDLARRNGLRLQKLVNTLLDLSRIEAGRLEAHFEPTDLAAFTVELTSNFRSACERAGLNLKTDCPPLPQAVWVDRGMWEKIVLNLLSNAFKFTLEGEIEVSLQAIDGFAVLTVRDTGIGVPEEEVPRLFERFHRVERSQGRTREGSGIGLAMTQELAHLLGGETTAESRLGHGTTLRVRIPFGVDRPCSATPLDVQAPEAEPESVAGFLEEAARWIPDDGSKSTDEMLVGAAETKLQENQDPPTLSHDRPKVLVVDDNADMRGYLRRVLSKRFDVEAAANGMIALQLASLQPPDLVITDVMMTGLDGLELVHELRAASGLEDVPIMLLSARAGEEARVQGLSSGADDYMTKPFSSRELIARAESHVGLFRLRRKTNQAVQRSEARFRSLFNSLDTGFCIVEALFDGSQRPIDYRFLEINPAFVKQTGIFDGVGRTALEILPNLEPFWIETYGQVALSGAPVRFQHGSLTMGRVFDVYAFPVEEKERRQVGILFNDITEQRAAEAAVRESEARFRQMADNAPVIIWVTDATGHCSYLNKQWYRFTGASEKESLGLGWTNAVHSDDRAEIKAAFIEANQSAKPVRLQYRLRRHDGEYRWSIDSAAPRFDDSGVFLGYIGSVVDVSEMKEAQTRLSHADRRKDEFLATLAHELRNPLAPIRTGLEILRLSAEFPESLDSVRRTMEQQTEQMVTLVDDLMEVSRITRGKLELKLKRVELREVIERAVDAARPHMEEAGHQFEMRTPNGALHLDADPHRLAQVLANLLNNASKYTPNGGRVELEARRVENGLSISVSDNGIGIAAEQMDRVFEMFAQIERPAGHSAGGLGIGLTLAKSLVELHGGRLEASSAGLGRGSVFTVFLPLPREENLSADSSSATRAPSESVKALRRRILVVDDNQAAAKTLSMIVRMLGHDCQTAGNGLEAIEAAESFQPELVLMDIGMPIMDGYQAAAAIRQKPWGKKIILIALTGWGQSAAKNRAKEAGFDQHLVKPAGMAEIKQAIALLGTTPRVD